MSKRINLQNWLERDNTLNSVLKVRPTGTTEPISGQEWAELMLKPQLSESIPKEVQRLFEGARGALIYGYFYYGLCFVGIVALFRVAEVALAHKRKTLDALTPAAESDMRFDESLKWLANQGIVQSGDWTTIVEARSGAFQPQEIITILEQVAEKINALFPVQSA